MQIEFLKIGLIYTLIENKIIIIAVMHLHRKPGYWIDRI